MCEKGIPGEGEDDCWVGEAIIYASLNILEKKNRLSPTSRINRPRDGYDQKGSTSGPAAVNLGDDDDELVCLCTIFFHLLKESV